MFRVSPYGINLIIETDDPSVKGFLEYMYEATKFDFINKKWVKKKIKGKIFNRKLTDPKTKNLYFEVGIGWAAYILNTFKGEMSPQDYNDVLGAIQQPTYRTQPFTELREYQNSDVLHVLKYRYGLYSCYTGYGKTQVIATLANYFSTELGKKVLLVTPNTKARDELIKRVNSVYGIKVKELGEGSQIQAIITSGLLIRSDYKDPVGRTSLIKELESIDVVLCDECEYCMNKSGFFIFDNCKNTEYRFGFSGTADKSNAKLISFREGLGNATVAENNSLIKYFGPSLVYRQPLNLTLNLINIITPSINNSTTRIYEVDFEESTNVYNEIMTKIFTTPEVCNTIVGLIKSYPLLFIPINNLHTIINTWIDNYFLKKFRVLLVCHEGYVYFDLKGKRTVLTLQEACDKIKSGKVDVIPSTASGFRALDFPGLKNILMFSGKIAGSVLQQVGRVARQSELNILSLVPEDKKNIPVYTKGNKERESLINEYYKYCKINKITIHENDLKK